MSDELTEAEQRDSDEINAALKRAIRTRRMVLDVLPTNPEHEKLVDGLVNHEIEGLIVKRLLRKTKTGSRK